MNPMIPKAISGPYPSMWAVSIWLVHAHAGMVDQWWYVTLTTAHDPLSGSESVMGKPTRWAFDASQCAQIIEWSSRTPHHPRHATPRHATPPPSTLGR